MTLHFSRVVTAREELELWSASDRGFSFVISNESNSGPGLHGQPGFVASWRPIDINRPAIRVGGSPFETFAEAEKACEAMLDDQLARILAHPLPRPVASGWISQGGEMSQHSSGWSREFDEPIALPDGKLVTLRDAANYITALPKKEADARVAGRDRSAGAGGRARRPDDDGPDRRHAGLEPSPRSGV
jgi:hypothetical protein